MRNILVVQDAGIIVKLDEVYGQRGHLSNHDTTQRVGHARVRLREHEIYFMRSNVLYFDFGKALLRHFVDMSGRSALLVWVRAGLIHWVHRSGGDKIRPAGCKVLS